MSLSKPKIFVLYFNLSLFNLLYSSLSSTYVTNLNRIFLLQKRALRAITNSEFRAPSAPLFAEFKILDIFKVNLSTSQNLCFYTTAIYYLCLLKIYSQIIKYTIVTLELYLLLGLICAGQTLSSSLYSIKDQKSGMLCNFQLHPFPVYHPLKDSLLISLTIKCYSK